MIKAAKHKLQRPPIVVLPQQQPPILDAPETPPSGETEGRAAGALTMRSRTPYPEDPPPFDERFCAECWGLPQKLSEYRNGRVWPSAWQMKSSMALWLAVDPAGVRASTTPATKQFPCSARKCLVRRIERGLQAQRTSSSKWGAPGQLLPQIEEPLNDPSS